MSNPIRAARWVVVPLVAVLIGVGRADDKPKPADPPSYLTVMQRKLTHTQKVLEGLALNDFEKIRVNADGLVACVKDATWRINDTEKYLAFSDDFLRRVEGISKAGKEKNVDAAALAYVDMTLTCVKCHQHLREARLGGGPVVVPPAPKPVVPKVGDPKKPTVMQRKLTHAQKVLEGLALNDFKRIESGADELTRCAQEASWRVLKTPKYEISSNEFLRTLEGMKAASKKGNAEAAALAYVDMTLTCVKCHKYAREEGIGLAPDLLPFGRKSVAVR